jgi:hypothetical protein
LLGRIALDNEKCTEFQRPTHAAPFDRAIRRCAELRENLDHNVEGGLRIIPGVHIGLNESDLHAALGC